jgi:hypothetical protein
MLYVAARNSGKMPKETKMPEISNQPAMVMIGSIEATKGSEKRVCDYVEASGGFVV